MTYWHINMSRNLVQEVEQALQSTEPLDIRKSSEYIVDIMNAVKTNEDFVVHVNIRNGGAIANLPFDCNVEVSALINRRGVHPFVMGELPHAVGSLVRRVADEQELIVDAALTGSRELAARRWRSIRWSRTFARRTSCSTSCMKRSGSICRSSGKPAQCGRAL